MRCPRHRWGHSACCMRCCQTTDCAAQGLAPFGHLADGRLHLIIVRKCSRLQFLRFLASIPAQGRAVWLLCNSLSP